MDDSLATAKLLGMVAVESAPDWHIGHLLVDDFLATSRGLEMKMMMGDTTLAVHIH